MPQQVATGFLHGSGHAPMPSHRGIGQRYQDLIGARQWRDAPQFERDRSLVDSWIVHTGCDKCRCGRPTDTGAAVDEQGQRALPPSKKTQQLLDVCWRRRNLAGLALMNVMKVKSKMTVSIRRTEFRKIEVGVEQADNALRRMRSDHLFDLGEGTHNDLHSLTSPAVSAAEPGRALYTC